MEPIVSSETSAIKSQAAGNYPKRNKLHLQHGESLKRRSLNTFVKSLNCLTTQSGACRKENISGVDHSKKDQLGGAEYH